jgi:hypothetical protein
MLLAETQEKNKEQIRVNATPLAKNKETTNVNLTPVTTNIKNKCHNNKQHTGEFDCAKSERWASPQMGITFSQVAG